MRHRYIELDSLRGLAAVSVILGHFAGSYLWNSNIINRPYFFFLAGREAVILFFVLSGFALACQLDNVKKFSYTNYLARRIFRIYPAYWVVMFFAIGATMIISPIKILSLSEWFNNCGWANITLNLTTIINTLLLRRSTNFDNVAWSLVIEMKVSVIFPIIYWIFYKKLNNKMAIVISFFVLMVLGHFNEVIYFSLFFVMGILLYKNMHKVENRLLNIYTFIVAIILYYLHYISFGRSFNAGIARDLPTSVGTLIFILIAIKHSYAAAILKKSILQFYGKISYSIYLFHLPIFYLMTYICFKVLYMWEIQLLSFILATAISYLSYIFIEVKFMQYANKKFREK